jgi:hypothetical protein
MAVIVLASVLCILVSPAGSWGSLFASADSGAISSGAGEECGGAGGGALSSGLFMTDDMCEG